MAIDFCFVPIYVGGCVGEKRWKFVIWYSIVLGCVLSIQIDSFRLSWCIFSQKRFVWQYLVFWLGFCRDGSAISKIQSEDTLVCSLFSWRFFEDLHTPYCWDCILLLYNDTVLMIHLVLHWAICTLKLRRGWAVGNSFSFEWRVQLLPKPLVDMCVNSFNQHSIGFYCKLFLFNMVIVEKDVHSCCLSLGCIVLSG